MRGPTGVIILVDTVLCILFVIQDMQKGNMLCGRYKPHSLQIQCQSRLSNVDFKGLACHNVRCKYLYATPLHSFAQPNDLAIQPHWTQHRLDNAFQHVEMADPDRGIVGATPVETLHPFHKG